MPVSAGGAVDIWTLLDPLTITGLTVRFKTRFYIFLSKMRNTLWRFYAPVNEKFIFVRIAVLHLLKHPLC